MIHTIGSMPCVAERIAATGYRRCDPPIRLRSGILSDEFVDCAPALAEPEVIEFVSEVLADNITTLWWADNGEEVLRDPPVTAIGGPSAGADEVVKEAAKKLGIRWFTLSKDGRIEGDLRAGDSVYLFDDVLTTGGALRETCDAVEKAGARVDGCHVLVARGPFPEDLVIRCRSLGAYIELAEIREEAERLST